MKKRYYLLMLFLVFTVTLHAQSTTETFETESHGSTSFTDNGVVFNIVSHVGIFDIQGNYPGTGWSGTANDNRYIDNSGTGAVASSASFSIKTTSNLFKVNRFWIFLSNTSLQQNVLGTLTVTGKLSGVTKFTQTKTTGFATSLGTTNGYTLIDLTNLNGQNYSNIIIDEMQVTLGGAYVYAGLDAFNWVKVTTAQTAAPVIVTPANGSVVATTTPTYSGTADANATVKVYVDGSALSTTATAAAGGAWSLAQPTTLGQGPHTVYATAQVSGNSVSPNSNTNTFTIDTTSPTVVVTSSAGGSGGSTPNSPIPFTVTFSEAVTNFVAGDITAGNATINGFSGSGNTYTFNAVPAASGTVTINIAANAAQDLAGNGNAASAQFQINYTPVVSGPTITGLSSTAANATYGVGNTLDLTIDFSNPVTVTGTPQLTLETGSIDRVVNYISGSGSGTLVFSYTVQAGDVSADLDYAGTTALNLNGGTIKDGSGNNAILTLPAPGAAGSLGANKNIIIDGILPTVSSVNSANANGTYKLGDVIAVTVNFSEPVSVTGTPQLVLETGVVDRTVSYSSGSGTSALTFNYTVQAGDVSSDLDYSTTGALSLNGGTIRDAAGNNTVLTLATPGAAGSLGANKNIVVDGIAPVVSNVNASTANGLYKIGDVISITATFSEPVTVTGTPQLSLETGAIDRLAAYSSGSGTNTLTFNYTVQTGDLSADLDYAGTAALALNGGTIKDAAGNNASLTLASPGAAGSLGANKAIIIDGVLPTVTITSTASGSTGISPIPFTITFSEPVTGFSLTGITATNATLGNFAGSGTTYTFNAIPVANGTVTINVPANQASDPAGNGNTAATQFSISYVESKLIIASAANFPSALNTVYGTASTSTSITLFGSGLSAGIVATPSSTANFEVSANNITYGNTATIGTSGTVSGTLYVRLKATAAANTNISGSVTLSSPGANSPVITIPASAVDKATLTYEADVKSKIYGDAVPALTGTVTGFVNGENIGTATTGTLSFTTAATISSAVGSFAVNGTGLTAVNYNFLQATGNQTALTITKRPVTVTPNTGQSKIYGNADPALSYTIGGSGLYATDGLTGLLSRAVGESVGSYAITQGTLAASSNYLLTFTPGKTFDIVPKTITVTAAAKSKTYGDADPALTYTFAPALVTGDSFTGILTRAVGENVGTYPINQGTLALNSNYTLTYISADLTIGKKTVTVTAAAKSKTYGDADPALTYTFTPALVTGDTFTGSLTRAVGENVGTYPINQGTLALNANYTLTYVGADLTIGKKTVTVTAAAKSKTYDDADPALTYTFAPALVTGDTFIGSLTRAVGENVGTYPINQGTLALNSNYTLTYISADLTIGKKTVTVTAAAKSKTYGDADPALTYTFAPALVAGDTFTGSLTRVPGENVGTYPINQGTLALNANYTLTYVGADLTIGKKTVTVTAAAKSKTYGDADPALTYTFAPALVTGDSFTGILTRTVGENVGTYPINQGTLALNANYTLTYVGADLTIDKKTVTVTAAAKSKTYGDADPALTYTFAPALVTGDTFTGSLTRVPGENVGTYSINQGTLALNSNYTLTYISADLTIGKKTVSVTAAAKSKTYGDADPALTYTFAPALVTGDSFTGALTRAVGENVGTYPINQGTLALNSNYTLTYISADLTIGKKTVTVTAAAKSKTYGDADPALTYTFAPALVTGDTFTGSLTRVPGENVGTYPINQGTLALNANYTLTYVAADLTIDKKTVTVTAAAKSKTYGDADPALTYTFTPSLVTGDGFTGALTRAVGENVGTYPINQGTLALNSNYTLTYVGADLTIGKKTVTVTAAAKSKTYGDADPALTYTFAPALVTGDTFTGSLTRAVGENVGTYPINQGTLALNSNYTLTYVGADLTIGKKTVTVTAAAKSKTYGDADPALTYTFAPALVTGDSFTGTLTRTVGENVGIYPINQGTLALNSNYTLTYVGADLTIGKKTVTVTAAAKSKTYGDADPALTYTFAPALVTGDSFTGSLTRAAGENAGTYAINQGTVSAGTNYNITYVGANLTINKALLTVTASNAVMCQSDGFPTFAVTYSGFKAGDTENALSTKPSVSTTANRNVAGTYALVPAGGVSNNYSFVYVNGTLTINSLPAVSIVSNKGTDISKGETAALTASGGTGYSWSTAGGIISGQNTATLTVRPAQTTTYTVRVTNASGCSSIGSVTINVAEDYKLVATNILTPNGDGVNDTWIVQNIDMYPVNEVRIFDRNGREMYNKKGYDNSWNGTIGGNELAEGTYYYIITYGPDKLVQKGFITIIRNR
ncbi:MBG domain-containing protein [Pedobacter sp.]|uniref:MBG domain-containing protein n=1 Tax=Pedobacter sp. TaxID=1411316 RepID=UPI0031D8DB22